MTTEFQYNKTFFFSKKEAKQFAKEVCGDLYHKYTEEYQREFAAMDEGCRNICKDLPYVVVYGEYNEF